MPNKDEIKKALLKAAGNPESGVIVNLADDLAKAVVELLQPETKASTSFDKRETPTITPSEKR